MIRFKCPSCGLGLRVRDERAGRKGKCPQCGGLTVIPVRAGAAPAEQVARQAADPTAVQATAASGLADVLAGVDGALLVEAVAKDPAATDTGRRVCEACAAAVPLNDRTCPNCGAAIPVGEAAGAPVVPRRACPSCQQAISQAAIVCARCGIRLRDGRPVPTTRLIDRDELRRRAEHVIRPISSLLPVGLCPVYSEAGGRHKPYAAWAIVLLTVAASLLFWACQWSGRAEMQTETNLKLWAPSATPRAGRYQASQLITYAFLHADPLHLAASVLLLLIFAYRINTVIGNVGMAVLYPLLVLAAGLAHLATGAAGEPMLGAFGAIAGLAGAYLVLFAAHKIYVAAWRRSLPAPRLSLRLFALPRLVVVLFCIGLILTYQALHLGRTTAHWTSLGAFVTGAVAAGLLLAARLVYSGGDMLSVILGRRAWPLLGLPSSHAGRSPGVRAFRRQTFAPGPQRAPK